MEKVMKSNNYKKGGKGKESQFYYMILKCKSFLDRQGHKNANQLNTSEKSFRFPLPESYSQTYDQ